MSIELLYIIPILALAVLVFLLIINVQKRSQAGIQPERGALFLGEEPKPQGDTRFFAARKSTEDRLNEYEQTIVEINKSLSNQNKVIEKFRDENSSHNEEVDILKAKLRELHKEYDIVISENYSLRAKVKSLQKKIDTVPAISGMADTASDSFQPQNGLGGRETMEMNMNLYEDTRLFKVYMPDDTKKFDATDLK
jgi:hypothetical protein